MSITVTNGHGQKAEVYLNNADGAFYWAEVDRPVPLDSCEEFRVVSQLHYSELAQARAVRWHNDQAMANYRKSRRGHVRSSEELSEMRAAFGPGSEVVDVISGERFTV